MEASTFGTPSKRIFISFHAVHNCPGCKTAAIARHVSFAQITCRLWSGLPQDQKSLRNTS